MLLALLCLTACSSAGTAGRGPALVQPDVQRLATDELETNVHRDWIVGSLMLCLERSGSVTVTKVEPSGGNVQITGFGLRPNPALQHHDLVGALSETLATAAIADGPRTLSIVCDQPPGNAYELVVQLHADASSARTDGLVVTYVSDGESRQLHIAHGIILCAHPEDRSDTTCKI